MLDERMLEKWRLRQGRALRWCGVLLMTAISVPGGFGQRTRGVDTPGCEGLEPKACLEKALEAMGGRQRLDNIRTVRLDAVGHTELMEQSYRQSPFITSYVRKQVTIDYVGQRVIENSHVVWPEADLGQSDSDVTLIVTPTGGVNRSKGKDVPCSAAELDRVRQDLVLGPERVLLTGSAAADLHYAAPETLRSTVHTVVSFTWDGVPIRVALNRFNHLPDAVETKQQFRDFWFYWGDVKQRVYLDNWRWVDGTEYPSNEVTERNGALWRSTQVLNIAINEPVEDKDFAIDAKIAKFSLQQKGWAGATFRGQAQTLADGITFFAGAWNTTLVKQPDGLVILESPISEHYTEGIVAEARKRYPDTPIKAVLSTSDSWPHVGGIRYDVAEQFPVYILDLNEPLLDRMVGAPHSIDPDALERGRKKPSWRLVSKPTYVGTGANRMLLVPLRGASTERQYMVYFPEHHLLYASDTLVVNDDKTIYDPELAWEVEQAVKREHLDVETVFAMHQTPIAWRDVMSMLHKAD